MRLRSFVMPQQSTAGVSLSESHNGHHPMDARSSLMEAHIPFLKLIQKPGG